MPGVAARNREANKAYRAKGGEALLARERENERARYRADPTILEKQKARKRAVPKSVANARQQARRDANRRKYRAQSLVGYYRRTGQLVSCPCERCGQVDGIHAHHEDYSKPLDVMWLCPAHHHERHKELREGATP